MRSGSLGLLTGALLGALLLGCRPGQATPRAATPATRPTPGEEVVEGPVRVWTSPKQVKYEIRTVPDDADRDEAEAAPQSEPDEPLAAAAKASGDRYKGTARKAAKTSIAAAPVEDFDDLLTLLNKLPDDEGMKKRKPPVTTDAGSNRVKEEQRNVRVRTFLYAASKENDNDYHLILGRAPGKAPKRFMTMELSGLPAAGSPSFARLKEARDAFKAFFGNDLPGTSYDFYNPPIPVEVEGSLFFDVSHATGSKPGPASLRPNMPTIWEVHPISKIVLEPD